VPECAAWTLHDLSARITEAMSATKPTPTIPTESRLVTRLLAFMVIVAGITMVVWVFFQAKELFQTPAKPLPTPPSIPKPLPGATSAPNSSALGETALRGIVVPLADLIRRLLILLLMCLTGSLVAALGIRWWGKR
jgi:hypothetical protein